MPAATTDLHARLDALMVRDQHRLRRRLQRARRAAPEDRDAELAKVAAAIDAAEARVARRRAGLPTPRYPDGLPIVERRDDLLAAIRHNQVVVVAGETGSGKSTQLPKLCLELGRGVLGYIGHTQPRRLAARTIAERVAEELGGEVGGTVGYAVRFTDRVGEGTLVKVMTDGILLAEIQRDRLLTAYDTIILDEAHERSLNIDFLLGYIKQLLPKRPDLKVIITSATIDTDRFSRHFDGAPVVTVSGRSYPVEVRYRPIGEGADDDRDQVQAICDAVQELVGEGKEDVLVFLSGEREIRDTVEALVKLDLPGTELLPLYARLSAAEQHRVFAPSRSRRRVVLATNVAETSLTVPGIRSVIDPGTARISRYNRRTKVQRLPIEAISQASANQRAGRCGRVAPGTCIRLFAEDDFAGRPEFTEPEILRTNLASVILQMAALGLGDVAAFPFVDPPEARSIKDGVALLEELGALEPSSSEHPSERLTPIGRRLATLPLDPRLGRMVLEGERNGCLGEVLVISSFLAIQDPRERPTGKEQAAAELHRRFADADSDFVAVLNLWHHLWQRKKELGSNQFRKLCRAEHLNHLRVREWQDVHGQLRDAARSMGFDPRPLDPDADIDRDGLHASLLAGLLSQIGAWDPVRQDYAGARQARFVIAPGTPLAKKKPKWVMAAELVETNRLWARTVARISPDRIERVAEHLVKRSYGEPVWEAAQGLALVPERVSLYGLPIASRRAPLSKIDPAGARLLFIQRALVEREWESPHAFLARNAERIEEVRALEDRTRRRDVLVGDDVLVDFFDARVPVDVTSGRAFDRWWRDERRRRPDLLTFTLELLIDPAARAGSPDDFPDAWVQGDLRLPLAYALDPGSARDGVTVDIPIRVLHLVEPSGFDWHVPGLRAELVEALIRSLPKPVRRRFVPVPDVVAGVLATIAAEDGRLVDVVDDRLARFSGEPIPDGSWDPERLPPHLRMTFRAVGDDGRPLASSKDLRALQARLRPLTRAAVAEATPSIEVSGLTSWSIDALPRTIEIDRDGVEVQGFPALVDRGASVAVRILLSQEEQAVAMASGTRRLLLLGLPPAPAILRRSMTTATALALAAAPFSSAADVQADCVSAAVDTLVAELGGPAWDRAAFEALQAGVRDGVAEVANGAMEIVTQVLTGAAAVRRRLDAITSPAAADAVADARRHLDRLLQPGFVTATGTGRLHHLVRYIAAIDRRLDKLPAAPARDRQLQRQVEALEERYAGLAGFDAGGEVRWLLEELRVSLFAQVLGTAEPVSEQRVRKALDRLVPRP
jgi:ATP-dependent helicase HrpA